jgi:dienelactone hydrolase
VRDGFVRLMMALPLAIGASPALAAQGTLADVRPGSVVERVVSASDTSEAYAVYLPPGYTRDREWPVLFAMDPRGEAMTPIGLFRPAAERMGWIVVSSYNTASDVKESPNAKALGAMLEDAQRALSVDGRRLYLTGFSGTAREAWYFAFRLPDNVAGVLGFGAGLPDESPFLRMRAGERPTFAFFGGAGDGDFNYDEVRTLVQRLGGTSIAHRFVAYAGPHNWGPGEVCTEAVEWMELQAVKRGIAQRPAAWQDSILSEAMQRAAARETAGDRVGALQRYRAVVVDFGESRDVGAAQAKVAALESDRGVRDEVQRDARQAVHDSALARRHHAVFEALNSDPRLPALERLLHDISAEDLKRDAARTDDTLAALGARRLMASLIAYTTFYGPNGYLEKGDGARAILLLNVASALRPDSPGVCYAVATVHARLGHADEAFAKLDCAAKAAFDPAILQRDPELASLRGDPRFAALVERLRVAHAAHTTQ